MDTMDSSRLIRQLSASLLILILGYFANATAMTLIARWLSAEAYGDFAVIYKIIVFGTSIALLGSQYTTVKFLPGYINKHHWQTASGLLRFNSRMMIYVSIFILVLELIVFAFVLLMHNSGHYNFFDHHPFFFSLWLIPLFIIVRFLGGIFCALQNPTISLALSRILLFVILATSVLLFVEIDSHMRVYQVLIAFGFSLIFIAAIQLSSLYFIFPRKVLDEEPRYKTSKWLKTSLQLTMSGMALNALITADIVMMELLAPNEKDVGILSAIFVISSFLWVIEYAVKTVMSPLLSPLVESGDKASLQSIVNLSNLILFVAGSIFTVVLVVFGRTFLGFFGAEFAVGYAPLIVLILGTYFSVMTDFGGKILAYSGHQNQLSVLYVLALIVAIVVDGVMIPAYGVMGAVIAFLISRLVIGVGQNWHVKRELGIKPLSVF